jgi:hypothetical protein
MAEFGAPVTEFGSHPGEGAASLGSPDILGG